MAPAKKKKKRGLNIHLGRIAVGADNLVTMGVPEAYQQAKAKNYRGALATIASRFNLHSLFRIAGGWMLYGIAKSIAPVQSTEIVKFGRFGVYGL